MVKKTINKNKVKNKNTNFVNVNNTIKIGSNKKKSYRRRSQPKSGAPIIVNVPQSFPQPYYIPSQPFHTQPPMLDAPVEIKNPTKPIIDDMKRDSINTISEIPNMPVAIPIKSNFKEFSKVVPHTTSPIISIKDDMLKTPVKQEEIIPKEIIPTKRFTKPRVVFKPETNLKQVNENENLNLPTTPSDKEYLTPVSIPANTRSKNVKLKTPVSSPTPRVRNPITGRMVKVGSATYNQMKKQNLI